MTVGLPDDFDPDWLDHASQEELAELAALVHAAASVWAPTPRQAIAEELAGEAFEILYGGAAGGGKSEWLLKHPEQLSRRYDGHRTLFLRRDYPRLRQSAIDRIEEGLFDLAEEWQWKERDHRLIHRETRSIIQFGHMQNEQEFERYLSSEWDCICIDEATELTINEYLKLTMRARTSRKKWRLGVRPHMALASNPGSLWLKARFPDVCPHDQVVRVCEHNHRALEDRDLGVDCDDCDEMDEVGLEPLVTTRAFVPAKIDDNPHVDPLYARRLNLLPGRLREAYRDGNWDVFEGQFFGEWNAAVHVVEPFEIPDSWQKVRGIDYGQAKPYACVWLAFDYDGRAYAYQETYGTGRTASEQAREVIAASKRPDGTPERVRKTKADPSIWTKQGSGESIASMYRREGLTCQKADNDRVSGANRVREYLREWDDGRPGLLVFSTCTNLIRTLPQLVHDKTKPEDVDTDGEDHCLVGSTLVDTASGPRRLDSLVGQEGWVRSPAGLVRFFDVRVTRRDAEIVRVCLADGRSVECTPDHLLLTDDGWLPAGACLPGTTRCVTLASWETPSSSTPPFRNGAACAGTSVVATSSARVAASTEPSTRRSTGRSRPASTSTTVTATPPTTPGRTLPWSSVDGTPRSIPPDPQSASDEHGLATLASRARETVGSQPSSALTPPVAAGIASVGPRSHAQSAGPPTKPRSRHAPSSVAVPVASVLCVGVEPIGRADVYDLAVEHPDHAFAVNDGVVVHNCYDALRYALMSRPPRSRPPREEADTIMSRLQRRARAARSWDHSILGRYD